MHSFRKTCVQCMTSLSAKQPWEFYKQKHCPEFPSPAYIQRGWPARNRDSFSPAFPDNIGAADPICLPCPSGASFKQACSAPSATRVLSELASDLPVTSPKALALFGNLTFLDLSSWATASPSCLSDFLGLLWDSPLAFP